MHLSCGGVVTCARRWRWPVARRKRSAPAKQRVSVADEGAMVGGGVLSFGGTIRAAGAALRGCLFRSLLSLHRYAALRVPPSEWLSVPDVGDGPVARRKRSAPAKQRVSVAGEGAMVGGGVVVYGGIIRAAGAASAGASFARCSRSIVTPRYGVPPSEWLSMPDVGDDPVARRKRSAPAKQRVSVAGEGAMVGGGVLSFGGTIRAAGAALRGCHLRNGYPCPTLAMAP